MAGFPSVAKGNKLGEKAKQPRAGITLDKNQLLQCIHKLNGNISAVADYLGSTRGSIYQRIENDPELKDAIKQARERQLDDLEKVVFERAQESNDTTLQLFILKTQGRHRGWDQDEAKNTAKDIATAAFDFIISKNKASQ
jgi:hypothetical protein